MQCISVKKGLSNVILLDITDVISTILRKITSQLSFYIIYISVFSSNLIKCLLKCYPIAAVIMVDDTAKAPN